MITQEERDAIVTAIENKECHLLGGTWRGGNGKSTADSNAALFP